VAQPVRSLAVSTPPRRACIIGLGLIGGSLGLALRARGWRVSGDDRDPDRVARALVLGVLDESGRDDTAEVTFVAVPVSSVAGVAREVLAANPTGLVTDVGSVKASVVEAVGDPRFIGGHPMAGSELEGLDGADSTMFEGAVWVLTPTAATADADLSRLRSVVASLGAEVVAVPPDRHDALVAVVSHVPHLTAATLMGMAAERSDEHAALLRLAAGGFRDMTRIASGHPAIWPDICAENRVAVLGALDDLIASLASVREVVDRGDREALLVRLEAARSARTNLPGRVARPSDLVEVRIPVPDRAGVLAEVTTLASELGASIADIEVTHSAEGDKGVLIVLVDAAAGEVFRGGLIARGFRPSLRRLQ